jgi:hypothetical protein
MIPKTYIANWKNNTLWNSLEEGEQDLAIIYHQHVANVKIMLHKRLVERHEDFITHY